MNETQSFFTRLRPGSPLIEVWPREMRDHSTMAVFPVFLAGLVFLATFAGAPLSAAGAGSTDRVYTITFDELTSADDPREVARAIAETHSGAVVEVGSGTARIRLSAARANVLRADPRVASVTSSAPGSVRADGETAAWSTGVALDYDGSGNVMTMGNDTYRFDLVGRLVESQTNGIERAYQYDRHGNRETCTQNVGMPDESDCQGGRITDPATNRIAGGVYDGAGNLTLLDGTFTYDAVNMLTSGRYGSIVHEYVYTADDERVAVYTVASGSWLWSVRDTSGKVLREFRSSDGPLGPGTANWQWSKDYVWRDALLLATRQARPGVSTPVTDHYHLDHLGSPRRITDSNDVIVGIHDYHPFGQELSGGLDEQPLTRMKFTGHERDIFAGSETSSTLDYMHARYYWPTMGRFLSVDPVLDTKKAVREPQRWNRYSYVVNNPMRYTDPDGREHVQEPGFTKPLSEAGGWADQPSVSWAFNSEAFLLTLVADEFVIGPAIGKAAGVVGRFVGRFFGKAEEAVEAGAKLSRYDDVTAGRSVANRATNVSRADFAKNLESNGFTKTLSKDGKVAIFEKDGVKYTLRDTAKSTGGPTAEVFKDGKLVAKIRLEAQ